jgi:ABC-type multidrug transport system ATPase subunit
MTSLNNLDQNQDSPYPDDEEMTLPTRLSDVSRNDGSYNHIRHSRNSITESSVARNEGYSLEWKHISMVTVPPKQRQKAKEKMEGRRILDNVWGRCPSGKVTGIMGPSGSGKTSLLNVLSGRMTNSSVSTITVETKNNVLWNGLLVDPESIYFRQTIAFVAQDDSLLVTGMFLYVFIVGTGYTEQTTYMLIIRLFSRHFSATPREAIKFSAKLRLPKTTSESQLDEIVTKMLTELNLLECSDTIVGGALIKGLSGGERKRTSVGVELVTRPRLVFLDEPTSGLDSFNALELIQVLARVARSGSSVLLTIHQPSSDIFTAMDRLILLKSGRVMYGGSISAVPRYFAQRGYPIPEHHNPADYIMTVAQTQTVETLEQRSFFTSPQENPCVPTTALDNADARRSIKMATQTNKPGFMVQVILLFQREMRNVKRNKRAIRARTGMTLMVSLIGGCIYWQVADSDFSDFINVQSTFGGLLLALMAVLFSTALPSLLAFATERPGT